MMNMKRLLLSFAWESNQLLELSDNECSYSRKLVSKALTIETPDPPELHLDRDPVSAIRVPRAGVWEHSVLVLKAKTVPPVPPHLCADAAPSPSCGEARVCCTLSPPFRVPSPFLPGLGTRCGRWICRKISD